MRKQKTTKRMLFSSVLSLLLCVTMLIGTTFAWFTDSVTSTNNIIKAGTLDVEMYWADGTEDPETATWTDASEGEIFNYDKWEPGYIDVKHIKIENVGTLALKYALSIAAGTEVSILADVIDVYYVDGAKQVASRDGLKDMKLVGTLREAISGLSAVEGDLDAGISDSVTIALHMRESAGNEYQGLSIGSSFSVQLLATQLMSEEDSFDETYDEKATYLNQDEEGNWIVSNAAEVVYFANQVNSGNSYKGETVLLANDIDLAGINWTPIGTTSGKAFQGTFDGQGYTISNLAGVYKNTNAGKYGKAFFGNCTGDVTIKNVTFTDASIANEASPKGNIYGIVCGYSYGNITFENVHVKDSYLSGLGKVGAILAYAADPGDDVITMKNCSVTNTTIAGVYNVAPFIGLIQTGNIVKMTDCKTSDITWVANAIGDYAMPYQTVSVDGHEGIYWVYSDTYNYAAWGNAYTTYDTWNNGETEMLGNCVNENYADPTIEYAVSNVESLSAALTAGGAVVTLADDVAVDGALTIPEGVTLEGLGYTLSNVELHMKEGATVKEVKFDGVNSEKGSQIYAAGVSVTIDGCEFKNTNWDVLQITPVPGNEIVVTNCTFAAQDGESISPDAKRGLHVEVSNSADADGDGVPNSADTDNEIKLTLTNCHFDFTQLTPGTGSFVNDFTVLGVWAENITASGNTYTEGTTPVTEAAIGFFYRVYDEAKGKYVYDYEPYDGDLLELFGFTK